ncbi:MAG: selenide, water dikinase SelD [Deltaproteobacteria bacterium]
MPEIVDPNVLVGPRTADDAAIYRVSDDLALIQTVDFFTPVVDDPYQFGAIAAANSLSDVYAMGGRPVLALNVVGYPRASDEAPLSALAEILRGGAEKAREAGIDIVGGHTVDDREPKYGLCVTGFVHPKEYWANRGGRAGDRLVLTKPIGTGIVTTAIKAGLAGEEAAKAAVETMATLNRAAAEAARAVGVRACTDITGFGLLGHLREMLSGVGARIQRSAVPLLPGAWGLAAEGSIPGGTRRNKVSLDRVVTWHGAIEEVDRLLLCDAQTSGGLLFAVDPARSDDMLSRLIAAGVSAAVVGELTPGPEGRIEVVP